MSSNSNPFLDSPYTHIGVHAMWAIICLGVMGQSVLPLIVMLYVAVGGHVVWVIVVNSHDVTSAIPQTHVVVACCLVELAFTCFNVTQHGSIGLLLREGLIIAVLQTATHLAYLTLSSTAVVHQFSLGEGRGRAELKGQNLKTEQD